MENNKIYNDLLLEIFNLSAENIQSIWHEDKDGKTALFITIVPTYLECPDCRNKHVNIMGYVDKKNNAIIENKNSIIKCIKKNANEFTNWHRFRNRLMYVLGHNETYHLYPNPKEKKTK